jgi:nucleoid DNA-binding protein
LTAPLAALCSGGRPRREPIREAPAEKEEAVATITKHDLVARIADRVGASKAATAAIVREFIGEIAKELANGNRLEFREFGIFEVRHRAARRARNPRTGASVDLPPTQRVRFRPGRKMKSALALGRAAVDSEKNEPSK